MNDRFCDENNKWSFNEDVSLEFEDMLSRSIPQYELLRELIFNIGEMFIETKNDFFVLDLGCSNGLNLDRFIKKFGATRHFKGVDISEPMLEKAIDKYKGYVDYGNVVEFEKMDLRNNFPRGNYSLIMSILSLQFIPIEYRQKIIQEVYDSLKVKSAFIFVEKVLGNTHNLNEIMVSEYYKLKNKNGYSYEDINRKKESLEGVLVPMTSNWNKDMLYQSGFRQIDTFWRWMNFEGYIAIK